MWWRRARVAAALLVAPLQAQAQRPTTPAAASVARLQPSLIDAIRCERTDRVAPSTPVLRWRGTLVRWAEWPVQLGENRINNRLVVALLDPAQLSLSLAIARRNGALAPWTLSDAANDALLAVNAGQFTDDGPWGWVRHDGREQQAPGVGTLAAAFAVDTAGHAMILSASELATARTDARWREALQSYPQLLAGGRPVAEVCGGTALDLTHRDARLVIGVRADGKVVVVMSRYTGAGAGMSRMAERVPIGPTTPEMAEIARRLGAVDALMLDGGLSAQLLIRDAGVVHRWPGLRAVPLALVAKRRVPAVR